MAVRKEKKGATKVDNTYTDSISDGINAPKFSEGGKNERLAITSATQARQIAKNLRLYDEKSRDYRRSRVMGAFNGNAPYSAQKLIQAGLDWHFNVSFNHMAGVVGRSVVPYLDFGADVRFLATFSSLKIETWKLDIIREEFVEQLKKWGGWMKFYTRLVQEQNLNGWSTANWTDEVNPWPEFFPQSRCFVPDQSPNATEDIDLLVLQKNYLIHELYRFIENPKAAKKAGWNVENVRKALMGAQPKTLNSYRRWEEWEKALRGGYYFHSYISEKVISVSHVFCRELDGKVSQWVVQDGEDAELKKMYSGDVDNNELFNCEKQFDGMDEVSVYFDVEAGDGYWHGSRGVGQRAYNTHVQLDKLRNQILNSAFIGTLVPIVVSDEVRGKEFEMFVAQPFCQVPPGTQFQTTQFPKLSTEMFQLDALLTSTSEQSIGDVVPDTDSQLGGDKTATQSKIDASRQTAVSRVNLKRHVDPIAKVVNNMVQRLLRPGSQNKFAKEFQKALKERGVYENSPKEIRDDLEARSYYEVRDITGENGAAIGEAFTLFRGDPSVEQRPLYERKIRNLLGAEAATDLLPDQPNMEDVAEAVRKQQVEISAMLDGFEIAVVPDDRHEAEAPEAVRWVSEEVQKGMSGAPTTVPFASLLLVAAHARAHIEALGNDKRFKQLSMSLDAQLKPVEGVLLQMQNQMAGNVPPGLPAGSAPPNGVNGINNGDQSNVSRTIQAQPPPGSPLEIPRF